MNKTSKSMFVFVLLLCVPFLSILIPVSHATYSLTANPDGSVNAGVNYASLYWHLETAYTPNATLERDFELFEDSNISVVTIPVHWSYLEPSVGSYRAQYIEDIARFCQLADDYSIEVIISLHTLSQSGSYTMPSWVPSQKFGNVVSSSTYTGYWLNMWGNLTDELENTYALSNIHSYHMMNEPILSLLGVSVNTFFNFCNSTKVRIRTVSSLPVSIRFENNQLMGALGADSRFFNLVDYGTQNYYEAYVTKTQLINVVNEYKSYSKDVMIGEFGYNTNNNATQASKYQQYLTLFTSLGIKVAQAWIWRSDSDVANNPMTIGEGYIICANTNGDPRPAFNVLAENNDVDNPDYSEEPDIIDFTEWTEYDEQSKLTVTSSRITWTGLTGADNSSVYYDYGVNYFGNSFTHYLTINVSSINYDFEDPYIFVWALTNVTGTYNDVETGQPGDYWIGVSVSYYGGASYWLRSEYFVAGVSSGAQERGPFNFNIDYYLEIYRTNSTDFVLKVYNDADHLSLNSTALNPVGADFGKFQYLQCGMSVGLDYKVGGYSSGYEENLDIGLLMSNPTVTITPATNQTISLGENVGFTYEVSGGVAPYTPVWYIYNSTYSQLLDFANESLRFSPSKAGNYLIYCNVTDDNDYLAKSNSVNVLCILNSSLPAVSLNPYSTQVILENDTIEISLTASGGTPPYINVTWSVNCPALGYTENRYTVYGSPQTFNFSESGTYILTTEVVDSLGRIGESTPVALIVVEEASYVLTIVYSSTGSANLSVGDHVYTAGSQIVLLGTGLNSSYRFNYWLVNGHTRNVRNPITITLGSDTTVQPIFLLVTAQTATNLLSSVGPIFILLAIAGATIILARRG